MIEDRTNRGASGGSPLPSPPSPTTPAVRRIPEEIAYVLRCVWEHPGNRGRRLRTVLRAAGFQLRGRLLGRPTVVPIGRRSRIRAHLHVHGSSKAVYGNPPDWPEMEVWRRALRPGDLFVDVGANVGVYTLLAAELGAEVVALEPDPAAFRRLRDNLDLNRYQVTARAVAAGERSGRLGFTTGLDLSNRLVMDGSSATTVPVVTVDSLVGERTVAGLKIDVEGAERLVLEGCRRALEEHRIRLVQIEWNDCSERLLGEDRRPVLSLLEGCGYELLRPRSDAELVPVADPPYGPDVFARPRRYGRAAR